MRIYLATPYSHNLPGLREWRFKKINEVAGKLMLDGHIVFSPISHSHPISLTIDNGMDADFYLRQDIVFLKWAQKMIVATFKDDPVKSACYDSYGLQWEVEQAYEIGIEVRWMRC